MGRGRGRKPELNGRRLATMLRRYHIKSRTVRIGEHVAKGYLAADFVDTWNRYLDPSPGSALQALQALQY